MKPEAMTEEMQALRRLLGDMPVVTTDALTVGLGWLLSTLKASLNNTGTEGKQEWATPEQVAQIYGVQRAQANEWLARLVEQGRVRRWQAETRKGTPGHMRYNLSDIEAAYAVERGC